MQRISLVEKEQAHPEIKKIFVALSDQGQEVLNIFKVMAHCPYIGRNFMRLGTAILRGEELPANLRELAILRVGNLAQANYEFTHHTEIGLKCGVTQKQIDAIADWATSPEFNDRERAVLAYTDEVARDIKVKDDTFSKLQRFFSEHAIVELTTVIGFYGMVCRILVAFQIELEAEARPPSPS